MFHNAVASVTCNGSGITGSNKNTTGEDLKLLYPSLLFKSLDIEIF